MISRDFRRLLLLVAPACILLYFLLPIWDQPIDDFDAFETIDVPSHQQVTEPTEEEHLELEQPDLLPSNSQEYQDNQQEEQDSDQERLSDDAPGAVSSAYHELFSLASSDHAFSLIDFSPYTAYNPNIIPHPRLADTWIVVAQELNGQASANSKYHEIVCNVLFEDDKLTCIGEPVRLPIATIPGKGCEGDLDFMALNIGPHDARLIVSPDKTPDVLYGSQSGLTCFSWLIQSFSSLVDDFDDSKEESTGGLFRYATEIQRPPPYSAIEKNFFLFWDSAGNMLAHHDVYPRRVFATLEADGSVGPDLAPAVYDRDEACLTKFLPKIDQEHESIHQATNSLQVTLCESHDPTCIPDDSNTMIISVIQHKKYYDYHAVYEPYVIAFYRRSPYELYGMSDKPLWIHGRMEDLEKNSSDMFYVTSMNWKSKDRSYHGYLDDEIFLSFGIEDKQSGFIDLTAAHLLENLSKCEGATNQGTGVV